MFCIDITCFKGWQQYLQNVTDVNIFDNCADILKKQINILM